MTYADCWRLHDTVDQPQQFFNAHRRVTLRIIKAPLGLGGKHLGSVLCHSVYTYERRPAPDTQSAAPATMHPSSGLLRIFFRLLILLGDDTHRSLPHALYELLGSRPPRVHSIPVRVRKFVECPQETTRNPWLEGVSFVEHLFLREPLPLDIDIPSPQGSGASPCTMQKPAHAHHPQKDQHSRVAR